MTDREELLKMMMALMEHGWGVDAALAEAERGLQAVNTKCEEQPDHSPDCGTKYRGCAPDCEFDKAETAALIHDLRRRAETAEARVRELEAKLGDYLDHVCARDAAVIVRPPEDA